MTCVVDANVLVAELRRGEPEHAQASAFLSYVRQQQVPLAAPAIVLAEVAGAVARGTKRRALGDRAAEWVESMAGLTLIPVDLPLARSAAQLAAEHRLRGYDAVYLALARILGAPLVTLDAEMRRRAPADVDAVGPGVLLATWLAA